TRRHRDVHGRTDPPPRARYREPAAGDTGVALGHHADEAARRTRRRDGARPDPQARAGPRPGAQGVAAGTVGDTQAMAQRPGHARRAAAAEDAGLAAAVPVSEPWAVRRG